MAPQNSLVVWYGDVTIKSCRNIGDIGIMVSNIDTKGLTSVQKRMVGKST